MSRGCFPGPWPLWLLGNDTPGRCTFLSCGHNKGICTIPQPPWIIGMFIILSHGWFTLILYPHYDIYDRFRMKIVKSDDKFLNMDLMFILVFLLIRSTIAMPCDFPKTTKTGSSVFLVLVLSHMIFWFTYCVKRSKTGNWLVCANWAATSGMFEFQWPAFRQIFWQHMNI